MNSEIPSNLVAVYGTLRYGQGNFDRIIKGTSHDYLGAHKISGFYLISLGGFPCAIPSRESDWTIDCDLFMVTDSCLTKMDALEGIDRNWYERVEVSTPKGTAYIYQYSPKSLYTLYNSSKTFDVYLNGNWLNNSDRYGCDREDIIDMTCQNFFKRAYHTYGEAVYLPKQELPKSVEYRPVDKLFKSVKL